jgi:hypothetical protein
MATLISLLTTSSRSSPSNRDSISRNNCVLPDEFGTTTTISPFGCISPILGSAIVFSYDPSSDQWSQAAPMAIPRHGVAAVSLGDRMIVPGGGIVQGFGPTDAVDAFIP